MNKKNLMKRIEQLEKENKILKNEIELWKNLRSGAKKTLYPPCPQAIDILD